MTAWLRTVFPEKSRGGNARSRGAGIQQEHIIREKLMAACPEAVVVRSARSHGPFDLIALLPPPLGWVLGIQSKLRGKSLNSTWTSPLPIFSSFYPVLLRRVPGSWQLRIG